MNIVFMGTPDFAVPSLEYLIKDGHNILCTITQPDRPKGRGNKVAFSPVKEKALEFNIPVIQPISIKKDFDVIQNLSNLKPDIIIVVAFGQILPAEVLSIPEYGCINVHASLLPDFRGAAPINWAIINGRQETGVTTMFMDAGLDTGDMLMRKSISIGDNETAGELHDRLKIIGAEILNMTLQSLKKGSLTRDRQDSSKSSYAPMLNKDSGRINWSNKSQSIKNLVRGTSPWPVAYSLLAGSKIKIWTVDVDQILTKSGQHGGVFKIDKQGIHVYTGDGGIIIKEVQPENGKRIDAFSYTLGHPISDNSVFV